MSKHSQPRLHAYILTLNHRIYMEDRMTKRLVDIDDTELRLVRESGDFSTIKETVSVALRELAATQARRREIARLADGALTFLADKGARLDAWR